MQAPFWFSTLPLHIADLIEQRLQKPSAMNYGNDEDFIVLDPLDDPIAVYKVFANVLIIKLWNDASGVRERFELAGSIEDLVDYGPCIGRRITVDVIGYGINVIECRR